MRWMGVLAVVLVGCGGGDSGQTPNKAESYLVDQVLSCWSELRAARQMPDEEWRDCPETMARKECAERRAGIRVWVDDLVATYRARTPTETPTETPTPGTSWIQCSPRTLSREAWATWAAQPGTSTPTATPTDLPIPDNPDVAVSTDPAIQVMINAMPTRRPTIPAGTYPVCVTVDAHGHQDYEPCATPTPTDAAIPESDLVMPNADSQLLCDGERCRWLLRPTPKVEFHPACVAVDQFGDDVGVVACPTATPDPDVMFCPGGTCQAVQP